MSEANETVSTSSSNSNYRLPQGVTLQHCAKLGILKTNLLCLIIGLLLVIMMLLLVFVKRRETFS